MTSSTAEVPAGIAGVTPEWLSAAFDGGTDAVEVFP
jgi:hypothetical protein